MESTKKCGKCQEYKPHNEFYPNKARYDNLGSRCKECQNEHFKLKTQAKINKRKRDQFQEGEEWRQVVGMTRNEKDYGINYEVSNFGNIRHKVSKKSNAKTIVRKYVKCSFSNGMKINKRGKTISDTILRFFHRAVAMAFIPNPENKRTVDHIDGDKSNNHVGNLKWATMEEQQQNIKDRGVKRKKISLMSEEEIIGERWKTIPQYPEYKISDHGRVRYPIRKSIVKYKITSGSSTGEYRDFHFRNTKGILKRKHLQLLVAQEFVENDDPEHKTCVGHKDDDKFNNYFTNLHWITRSQNTLDAYNTGAISSRRPILKLTEKNEIVGDFISIAEATKLTPEVSRTGVNRAVASGGSSAGWYWIYKENYDPSKTTLVKKDLRMKQIQQIDDTGNVIRTFESGKHAAIALGNEKYRGNITRCACRGYREQKTAYGYGWKYVD
jgi:hypothetical protein